MTCRLNRFFVTFGLVVLSFTMCDAQVIPTPWFMTAYDNCTTVEGAPVSAGSVIRAYDPDAVQCGEFTVTSAGDYGFMAIYGDDPNSAGIDEGAEVGDVITFTINGLPAVVVAGDPTWSDQTIRQVQLDYLPPTTCCIGTRGNVNGDVGDATDISDLVAMVNYLFLQGLPPACFYEANTNGVGCTDISDVVALVDYLFITFEPLALCP